MGYKGDIQEINSWIDTIATPYLQAEMGWWNMLMNTEEGEDFNEVRQNLVNGWTRMRDRYWFRVPQVFRSYINFDACAGRFVRYNDHQNFHYWVDQDGEDGLIAYTALAEGLRTRPLNQSTYNDAKLAMDQFDSGGGATWQKLYVILTVWWLKCKMLDNPGSEDTTIIGDDIVVDDGGLYGKLQSWYLDLILGPEDANGVRPEAEGLKKFFVSIGVIGGLILLAVIIFMIRRKR